MVNQDADSLIPNDAFRLVVDDYVPYINPINYGISDFQGINPNDYFVTSGDAVCKAAMLEKELRAASALAKKQFKNAKGKKRQQFVRDLQDATKQCKHMLNTLLHVRGEAIFLEIEWINHILICRPKNPRAKED